MNQLFYEWSQPDDASAMCSRAQPTPPVRVAALRGQIEFAPLPRPRFRATQSKNVSSHQNKRSLPARIAASHWSARAFLYFPRPTFAPCERSYLGT